jgi:hypothetical protein
LFSVVRPVGSSIRLLLQGSADTSRSWNVGISIAVQKTENESKQPVVDKYLEQGDFDWRMFCHRSDRQLFSQFSDLDPNP